MRSIARISFAALVASCSGGSGVSSNDAAKAAYLGLDESIDKAITAGFAGFNAAQSANIPNQTANGEISGSMTISGQVDQGASANKQMRLNEALANYEDTDAGIVYATDATAPTLDMSLKGIPTGTLTGSLDGDYDMTGTLTGRMTLAVTFSGALESDDAGGVERKPGKTRITGTATSGSGVFTIDVTR